MNSNQAKQLSLPDLLARLGHEPVKVVKGGRELWYASPFRAEKDPSFHTSFLGGKWIWNDFGDIGGTVIDFVMRHQNFSRVSDALRYLEKMFPGPLFDPGQVSRVGEAQPSLFSFQQQPRTAASNADDRQLEFISAGAIRNPVIYAYLEQVRKIPRVLADKYLQEVRYRNLATGKEYFAFGMENASGGYEVRVATDEYVFKSALIARDVSHIRGMEPDSSTVSVFEGMTDFLSLLAMLQTDHLKGDAIVMHSLSSFHRAVALIQETGYTVINTFLDNNQPGEDHTIKFKEAFGNQVVNQSPSFLPHVDLNDALRSGNAPRFTPANHQPRQ